MNKVNATNRIVLPYSGMKASLPIRNPVNMAIRNANKQAMIVLDTTRSPLFGVSTGIGIKCVKAQQGCTH